MRPQPWPQPTPAHVHQRPGPAPRAHVSPQRRGSHGRGRVCTAAAALSDVRAGCGAVPRRLQILNG